MNTNGLYIEPYKVFDTSIDGVVYIGTSGTPSMRDASWSIKKFLTVNGITKIEFPAGSQEFMFKWDERATYTYI